jgi:hypothetical protein
MGFSGSFTAALNGCLSIGKPPTVSVSGSHVLFSLPAQLIAASLGCSAVITGGGGKTATVPVTISVTTIGLPTPSPTPSATPAGLGPVIANPTAVLLNAAIGSPASASVTVTQMGFSGSFTAALNGCLSIGKPPTVSVNGSHVLFSLPAQLVAASLGCSAVITGGGGKTATVPVTISVTTIGSPTPSPTPSATPAAFGPVIANPNAVLLNAAIGNAASQAISVTQTGFDGPFTAALNGCLSIGNPPTVSVNGTTVIFSLPAQLAGVNLGCSAVITGGGGKSATVPITITVAAVGSPTPQPTSSGTSGAGPLTASPTSILLNPSAVTPAIQNIIVNPSSEGPFTATTSCLIPLGSSIVTTVTGNVITVTAPAQVVSASIGCSTAIVSTTTGNSVSVPIVVNATAVGPTQPSPSPAPTGNGPLYTVPSSILIDPGVTAAATQNIEIYDRGFTGTYSATIASGCLALRQPSVALVNGNVATITVPGQLINAALLCSVRISDGTQTVNVPVTISATVLGGLKRPPVFDSIAFAPPTLSFDRAGDSASVDVIGAKGPYRAGVACPAGTSLDATIAGGHATVRAAAIGGNANCVLTITSASGTYGQIPIRVGSGSPAMRGGPLLPGRVSPATGNSALTLKAGERRDVPLSGSGPYTLTGSCSRLADVTIEGGTVRIGARSAGSCGFGIRAASGEMQNFSLVVRSENLIRVGR